MVTNKLIIVFFFAAFITVIAQDSYNVKTVVDTIPINLDNIYKLSSTNIVQASEQIILKNFPLSKSDYQMNYRNRVDISNDHK